MTQHSCVKVLHGNWTHTGVHRLPVSAGWFGHVLGSRKPSKSNPAASLIFNVCPFWKSRLISPLPQPLWCFSVGVRRGQAWADVFPCLCAGAVGNWAGLRPPGIAHGKISQRGQKKRTLTFITCRLLLLSVGWQSNILVCNTMANVRNSCYKGSCCCVCAVIHVCSLWLRELHFYLFTTRYHLCRAHIKQTHNRAVMK